MNILIQTSSGELEEMKMNSAQLKEFILCSVERYSEDERVELSGYNVNIEVSK